MRGGNHCVQGVRFLKPVDVPALLFEVIADGKDIDIRRIGFKGKEAGLRIAYNTEPGNSVYTVTKFIRGLKYGFGKFNVPLAADGLDSRPCSGICPPWSCA